MECYDGDTMEWYDAAPMNLNRSALSACVLAGLPNARSFSYLAKAVPAAGADQAHHSWPTLKPKPTIKIHSTHDAAAPF